MFLALSPPMPDGFGRDGSSGHPMQSLNGRHHSKGELVMKAMGIRLLAVPVLLAATVSFASAQEGAKQQARETTQDVKDAAKKTGHAISDSWITLKIHSQFIPEDALSDSDIDVDTKSGVVTLNGTVASEAGRTKAIAIAKATDGVNAVTDNLKVASATASARPAGEKAGEKTREVAGTSGKAVTDGWLKSKIASQFVTEDLLDKSDIDIDVSKGAVALNGAVRTMQAKNKATAFVKGTDGVKSVQNNLKIDPNVK
jgi:hyperosmotically inducible protein